MEISVGSKERGNEMKMISWFSGSMTFSTNARPIPQVRVSIPEYIPFPWTKNWLHIKGHVAYGMFTDEKFQERFTAGRSKYTKETLFHSKANFPEGGESAEVTCFGGIGYRDGRLSLEAIAIIRTGRYCVHRTVGKTFSVFSFQATETVEPSESDQINILGNHVGSYSAAVGYHFPTWKIKAYWEHFLRTARE